MKDNLPTPPPLFRMLQQATGMAWKECYQVFNMGVRLEAIVPEQHVQTSIDLATALRHRRLAHRPRRSRYG